MKRLASVWGVAVILAVIAGFYGASPPSAYAQKTYTITASAGTGGSISPSGIRTVYARTSQTFTITPYSGYTISNITVDGASVGARSTYTFTNVTANHRIQASFRSVSGSTTYTLTITTAGTGSGKVTANPAGPTYASGTQVTLTATPASNSVFVGYSGGCNTTALTCSGTMTRNVSVTATFNAKTTSNSYSITASAGTGGIISPAGIVSVPSGSGKTFVITPNSGHVISDVTVDSRSVGAVGSYTFTNVTANHSITARFSEQSSAGNVLLLHEGFEDLNWASRSWYDNTRHGLLATSGCYSGNCLQWSWASGATIPTNGAGIRKMFTPTEELFFTYYVKMSSNWQGSGSAYHPHLIMLLSDRDAPYQGPAHANLATYFEISGSYANINPVFIIQDSVLINTQYGTPPINLAGTTQNRAVAGCNGDFGDTGSSPASCYQVSGVWYNGRHWKNTAAILSPNTWHKIEYYLKMNTISNSAARDDGILQQWVDGVPTIVKTNMVYRTNQQATKKWTQLFLGPYIGDGSPTTQTIWIDELSIYN
jgi:hypothetical protein